MSHIDAMKMVKRLRNGVPRTQWTDQELLQKHERGVRRALLEKKNAAKRIGSIADMPPYKQQRCIEDIRCSHSDESTILETLTSESPGTGQSKHKSCNSCLIFYHIAIVFHNNYRQSSSNNGDLQC